MELSPHASFYLCSPVDSHLVQCRLTYIELSYIAGIFDGEGTVSIIHQKNSSNNWVHVFYASITNTNKECLDMIKSYLGLGHMQAKKYQDTKTIYVLHFRSQKALSFLTQIEPYLIIKKKRVQLCIEFQKGKELGYSQPREITYCKKIRVMNNELGRKRISSRRFHE